MLCDDGTIGFGWVNGYDFIWILGHGYGIFRVDGYGYSVVLCTEYIRSVDDYTQRTQYCMSTAGYVTVKYASKMEHGTAYVCACLT